MPTECARCYAQVNKTTWSSPIESNQKKTLKKKITQVLNYIRINAVNEKESVQ